MSTQPEDEATRLHSSAAAGVPAANASAVAAPVAQPFDPARMLNDIIAARNPQHEVSALVGLAQVKIGKDNLRFEVRSALAGYVYVLMLDAKREHLFLMFPNAVDPHNRIKAGQSLHLPGKNWPLVAQGPAGSDQFLVLVSESPRDFTAASLQKGEPFAEFDLNRIKAEWQAQPQPLLFAGQAKCEPGTPCPAGFGAAGFVIEEVEKK
jgi:hypothetical protein